MKKTSMAIAGLLVLSFAFAPTVSAQNPDCSEVADESDVTVPLSETGEAGDVYVDADTPGLFQESNDIGGLQTEAGSCVEDGSIVNYEADAQLAPPAL